MNKQDWKSKAKYWKESAKYWKESAIDWQSEVGGLTKANLKLRLALGPFAYAAVIASECGDEDRADWRLFAVDSSGDFDSPLFSGGKELTVAALRTARAALEN